MRSQNPLSIPQILRLRRRRLNQPGQKWLFISGISLSLVISLGLTLAAIFVVWAYTGLTRGLPAVSQLEILLHPEHGQLLEPTRFYDRTGTHILLTLENPAAGERQFLDLDTNRVDFLPSNLISTTLATNDPNFYSHSGYDLRRGLDPQPHTLAEALAAELLLWEEDPDQLRAVRMRLLAAQMTRIYGRDQILVWYLNSTNYGRLAYGASAAAQTYFNKPAHTLNLMESALLVAASETPALNPMDAPTEAQAGMESVMSALLEGGWISAEKAEQALLTEVTLANPSPEEGLPAPAFTNLAFNQLTNWFDPVVIERGGLRVITTLDFPSQQQLNCTAQVHRSRLQAASPENLKNCTAALLLPTLPPVSNAISNGIEISTILYDPSTGELLAMTGDPVSPHRAGSILTPFIYLTGLSRGYTPGSMFWDIPSKSPGLSNFDQSYHGPVRLRTALANDYLIPAAEILEQVGSQTAWQTARRLGFALPESAFQSSEILTGSESITLLAAAQAYGVLANAGLQTGWLLDRDEVENPPQPVTILRVETVHTGKILDIDRYRLVRPLVNSQLSYLLTDMLADEAARWPSLGHPNPLEIGRPVAAKPGFTSTGTSQWVLGYTPQRVVGVWIGAPEGAIISPSIASASLWHALTQYVHRELPSLAWELPAGINRVTICDPSGLLPTLECPQTVSELYVTGTEPTQPDNLFRSYQVNRETGQLATVDTPPDLVTEQVYMLLPPEATQWALEAGIPVPPDTFDILGRPDPGRDVEITSPMHLSYISGEVDILGSASVEDFSSFTVRIGKGLNPRTWIRLGEANSQPVESGLLGSWDTQNLSGLYAIQLSVVNTDQQIQTTVNLVTVDNQPPEVEILNPRRPGTIFPSDTEIQLQADVRDNLSLAGVSFFIDGRLVGRLTQAPYVMAWDPAPGDHILRVTGEDEAGNTQTTEIEFTVPVPTKLPAE